MVLVVLVDQALELEEVLEILLDLELLAKEIMEVLALAMITLEVEAAVLGQLEATGQEARAAMVERGLLLQYLAHQ